MKQSRIMSTALLGLFLLTACAPTAGEVDLGPACDAERVITSFAPDRGEGASYQDGESITFHFSLECPGEVWLETNAGSMVFPAQQAAKGAGIMPQGDYSLVLSYDPGVERETVVLRYSSRRSASDAVTDQAETWFRVDP